MVSATPHSVRSVMPCTAGALQLPHSQQQSGPTVVSRLAGCCYHLAVVAAAERAPNPKTSKPEACRHCLTGMPSPKHPPEPCRSTGCSCSGAKPSCTRCSAPPLAPVCGSRAERAKVGQCFSTTAAGCAAQARRPYRRLPSRASTGMCTQLTTLKPHFCGASKQKTRSAATHLEAKNLLNRGASLRGSCSRHLPLSLHHLQGRQERRLVSKQSKCL